MERDAALFGCCTGICCGGDEVRCATSSAVQRVGDRIERQRSQLTSGDRAFQSVAQQHELLATSPGAGHDDGRLDEHDAGEHRVRSHSEEHVDPRSDLLDRRGDLGEDCVEALVQKVVSVVGDRDEEVLLPTGEVVVQRTPRHASLVEDLSDRSGRVALFHEEPKCDVDEVAAGSCCLFLSDRHTSSVPQPPLATIHRPTVGR